MDELLFSESHSRYLIGTDQPERVKAVLSAQDVPFSEIGRSKGQQVSFTNAKKRIFRHSVTSVAKQYYSLEKVMA
jgi:hypothetical protein